MTSGMTGGWLDWREHSVGPARPCRLCARPAICRDHLGRPCHKVCAEQHLAADTETANAGPDALVIDLDTHRRIRPRPAA